MLGEDRRVLFLPEGPARDHDERQTEQGTCHRTQGAVIHSLVEEAEARREHQPGRDGIGMSRKAPLVRKNSSCARRVSTSSS